MKWNLAKRLLSILLACTMLTGALTVQAFAATEDFIQETNGDTFTLPGQLCDLVTRHELYGIQDYLAYVWQNEFSIWFFDDLTDVRIRSFEKNYGCFGLASSEDVTFTVYLYDLSTLKLKSVTDFSLLVSNQFSFQRMFVASFDIYTDDTYTEYFFEGVDSLPGFVHASDDVETFVNGRTFTMEGKYVDVLKNHDMYKTGEYEYLAYVYNDEFSIWFFSDDFSNVTVSTSIRANSSFALIPSKNLTVTRFVYDKDTLEKKIEAETITFTVSTTTNKYLFSKEFMGSFRIHLNGTTFYNPVGTTPPPDIVNKTYERTFSIKGQHYDLITNQKYYETNEYLAYGSGDEFVILFFMDLSNAKIRVESSDDNSFGIRFSDYVAVLEYVYDKNFLQLKRSTNYMLRPNTLYNFSYEFIASVDIYSSDAYNDYFYLADGLTIPSIEFEPLAAQDAQDLLRFISGAGVAVKVEEKLSQYYNFLVGNISDPEEKFRTAVSFQTYCYLCLKVQLSKANEDLDLNTTFLMDWIKENTKASTIIYSEIKDEILDSLKQTIAKNVDIPSLGIGIDMVKELSEYGEILVYTIGALQAVKTKEEINYLLVYIDYLEALKEGDEFEIVAAEMSCEIARTDMVTANLVNTEEMERYAQYIFNIEQDLK